MRRSELAAAAGSSAFPGISGLNPFIMLCRAAVASALLLCPGHVGLAAGDPLTRAVANTPPRISHYHLATFCRVFTKHMCFWGDFG